jgi:hypothetical protein
MTSIVDSDLDAIRIAYAVRVSFNPTEDPPRVPMATLARHER